MLVWYWGRRGGLPKFTLELVQALQRRGEVELYLSLSRQSELFAQSTGLGVPGWHVDTFDRPLASLGRILLLPVLARRFGAFLRTERIEAVFCPMTHVWNPAIAPTISRLGIPYLLMLHDAVFHPGEESALRFRLMRRDIRAADAIVTLSDHVRRQLVEVHGYPVDRIHLLPHPTYDYGVAGPRRAPRGRPFRMLFFGRILPYKGLDLLLRAYRRLAASGRDLTLRIVGSGDVAPYRDLLDTPGVSLENRWLDDDEIGTFLAEADLLIAPYVEASQSGVVTAAYRAGLPVIGTPVGGLAEQIEHGRTGLLAAGVSDSALAEAIASLVDDAALYERLSAGAAEAAAGALSWDAMAEGLVTVLTQGARR